MRYTDHLELTSTAGVLTSTVYRANSVFDPFQPTGGHQPMGYDEWALLYNHYIVLGSKVSVQFLQDGSPTGAVAVGVYLDDTSSSGYTSADEYIEAKKGSYCLIPFGDRRNRTCTSRFSAKKFFKVKDLQDNMTRLGAPVGTNPDEEAMYHIWMQCYNSTTDTLQVQITIDYIVEFSEPKSLAQS